MGPILGSDSVSQSKLRASHGTGKLNSAAHVICNQNAVFCANHRTEEEDNDGITPAAQWVTTVHMSKMLKSALYRWS
jgi:hypothetical protein